MVPNTDPSVSPKLDPNSADPEIPSIAPKSFKEKLEAEVRSHPFGYGVLAVGLVMGPILLKMIFPEITTLQAVVGGLAFGVYITLSAVPQKFV